MGADQFSVEGNNATGIQTAITSPIDQTVTPTDGQVLGYVAAINTWVPVANSAGSVTAVSVTAPIVDTGSASNPNIGLGTNIDVTKLADGSVNNTEFQYINSLTSNAQDQIDALNTDIGLISSGATTLFLQEIASDVVGYETLRSQPSSAAENFDQVSVTAGTSPLLIDSYIVDPGVPGITTWPAGNWIFHLHVSVDANVGVTQIIARVYSRTSGGVETLLFSATSGAITTATDEYQWNSIQTEFQVAQTDRLVVKFYATTTSVPARTVKIYYQGSTRTSYIGTTLPIPLPISGAAAQVVGTPAGAAGAATLVSLTNTYLPVVDISHGGTNSSAALNNNRAMVSSGGAIIESNASTTSQVLIGGSPPAFGAVPAAAISTALASSTYTASSTFPAAAQATLTGNNGFCVAVQGKYAYVSDLSGSVLSIVDVSDPAMPSAVGAVTLSGQLRGLAVQGNYAYVCNNSGNFFYIVDVSNPAAPTSVGSVSITSPYGMCLSGKYAYVLSENGASSTIKVIDISIPTSPAVIGSAVADNATSTKLDIKGKYLYTCSSTAQTISIYDISVPTAPTRVNTPLNVAIAAISVQASGRYLYAVDSTNKLVVVDVSNPTAPALVTTLTLTHANGGLHLAGRYLFVQDSSFNVIRIVDIQIPGSPTQVVTIATGSNLSAVGICVAGKYAYLAYTNNPDKLGIIDLGGIETGVIKAASIQTGQALITENLNVAGSVAINSGLSVGPSGINCDGLMTGKALNLGDGTVTQGSSVTTTVTLNASSGVITTFSQSAAAGATSTFTVNNSFCLSTSVVLVCVGSYAGTYGTNGFPLVTVSAVANGSFNVRIVNAAPSNSLSGVLKINFAIL